MQDSSQWCSIVENDGELMLMALNTHFLPQQQYSRVNALFLAFHAMLYGWGCQFLSLFSQDNEHTELTVLLFIQNSYAIFAYILQHYHDFQNNVAIFPSIVQAYTQPYSFDGRLKLINCQVRHELSVTIHEISTSWKKKTLDGRPNIIISSAYIKVFECLITDGRSFTRRLNSTLLYAWQTAHQ